jgi:dUTPase
MPQPTLMFYDAIIQSNKKFNFEMIDYNMHTGEAKIINKAGKTILMFYDKKYLIFSKIQIPTGIGILIPQGYHFDIRSKSSNFQNEFTFVTGLIDEDYTYGMGAQIVPLNNTTISIEPNQKFIQLELKKTNFVTRMSERSLSEWENDDRILRRRKTRQGGFGHTGKF